jgi:nicotinamidase-related amidase
VKRLEAQSSVVIVVDLQERLMSVMPERRRADVVRAARLLCEGARLLGAAVLASQQYTKGLGPTVAAVEEVLASAHAERFEKTSFSAVRADGFSDALQRTRATSAVVVGVESHVCVFQTVRDLVDRYLDVHVAVDGVCSRDEQHRDIGLRLCERSGGVLTTAETVLFDWLGAADTEQFKQISRLVR